MSEFKHKTSHREEGASASRRLALSIALAASAALLPSCGVWDWTKSRFSSSPPPAAPAPAPVPAPPAPVAQAPVVPMPEPSLPPAPTPIVPPPSVAAVPLASEPPRSAVPMPVPAAPAADMRQGRYAVQVGVFLVAANAESIRTHVAAQLAADPSLAPGEKIVRNVKKGERTHVVVGDVADRRAADDLAARLRTVLRQDVVVFQR